MKKPRILVVRGGAIGDFIMTLPAVGALREQWPDAHIEILGYPHIAELARGRQYVDAIRSIDAKAMAGFFIPRAELDPVLVEYFSGFNLVISYLFDPDKIFSNNVRACGVKQVVDASPRPKDQHAAEHYVQPLQSLAIYVEAPRPRVYPNESDRKAAANFLKLVGREPLVAIHPGSGSEKKNWPVEKFAALGRWLVDELAAQLLVVKGEADNDVTARLRELLGERPITLAQGLKLTELAAVLERCVLFLGNDSGITHLAAAVGTPTIAVFGAASLPIWEPLGPNTRVVQFGEQDVVNVRAAVEQLWGVPRG